MRRNQGITVIELLIVVAILLILAAILWPAPHHPESARITKCMNNQRQISLAIVVWSQDHEELLPKAESVWQDITLDKNTLICPMPLNDRQVTNSYGYSAVVAGKPIEVFANPSQVLLTCDAKTARKGNLPNICYGTDDIAWRHRKKGPPFLSSTAMSTHSMPPTRHGSSR